MRPLLTLHHGLARISQTSRLEAIGRAIGLVTRLVLVAILFAVPLIAMLAVPMVGAVMVAVSVGGGALVYLPLLFVFWNFIGVYVVEDVQTRMEKAMNALLYLDIDAGHFGADVFFFLREQCGILTRQRGQRVTVQQVLTEALADWFVKRGATLPDGLKAAYSPEKYNIRECDLCGLQRLMTPKEIADERIPLTSEELAR
jgi:hypothetical protein